MINREPVVSGMFYPGNKQDLEELVRGCFLHEFGPGKLPPKVTGEKIFGIICPHAGLIYSGPIACHSFYQISDTKPELIIIVGPNHYGVGQRIATTSDDSWSTPIGKVEIDTQIVEQLNKLSEQIKIDSNSHSQEHSIEVQIPILQKTFTHNYKILPISLLDQSIDSAKMVGNAIAKIAKMKDSMIIGSSDFTHYETNEFAYLQDSALIEPILEMNVDKMYEILQEKQVTSCGYGAMASTITACKELGATRGILQRYATSGDVQGDKNRVVGYASIIFV